MKDRIKAIRRAAGMTQAEFASHINVGQQSVTAYENGLRTPSNAVIASICYAFNVSEEWLRTGEGEMKRQLDRNEQISKFVGDVLTDVPGAFRKRFASMLSAMTQKEWALLEQMAKRLIDEKEE